MARQLVIGKRRSIFWGELVGQQTTRNRSAQKISIDVDLGFEGECSDRKTNIRPPSVRIRVRRISRDPDLGSVFQPNIRHKLVKYSNIRR